MVIFSISFPDLINFITLWIPLQEGFGTLKKKKQGVHPARRVWGEERRPKDRVTLQLILVVTLTFTHPKTVTLGCVSVCDKYLHWPRVSVKNLDM
jgi:hypothetical protein